MQDVFHPVQQNFRKPTVTASTHCPRTVDPRLHSLSARPWVSAWARQAPSPQAATRETQEQPAMTGKKLSPAGKKLSRTRKKLSWRKKKLEKSNGRD